MARITLEEIIARANLFVGERTDDDAIQFLEDLTDSYSVEEKQETEDWESKYKENDESWRKRYRERFMGTSEDTQDKLEENVNNEEPEKEETKEDITIDDLFERKEK